MTESLADKHDAIRDRYFFYCEDHCAYRPRPEDDLFKAISVFSSTKDDFQDEYISRVGETDAFEFRCIVEALAGLRWDSGYKGRDLPIEFRVNDLARYESLPRIYPLKSIDTWSNPDEVLSFQYLDSLEMAISGASSYIEDCLRPLKSARYRNNQIKRELEEKEKS